MARASARSAPLPDDATVATLDQFRDFSGNTDSFLEYLDYNREFHTAIAAMCGNSRIALIEQNLVEEFERLARYSLQYVEASAVSPQVHEHAAIIDAIQAHDRQEAARLAHEHIGTRLAPVVAAFRTSIDALTD